jgi:nicotinamidase-related amidase
MKTAILVIDVQAKLMDTAPRPEEADQVIKRINHITALGRTATIPVIFVQHEEADFLEPESEGWQLQKNLLTKPGDQYIRKTTGDSFLNTGLDEKLKALDINNLVICGFASEFCVDHTTRRATGLGYTVQLVSDAHTTRDKEHLPAKKIREHHNRTLSESPAITLVKTADLRIEQ